MMILSFRTLMGSMPTTQRSASEVTAAGVTIKKEDRQSLSTSDQLKLSKAAREGGIDKFTFFASDGKLVNDFQTVYDLHMRIETLSKALTHFDMQDVFQIIPPPIVEDLSGRLKTLFSCQTNKERTGENMAMDTTNPAFALHHSAAQLATVEAGEDLNEVAINNIDIISSFQDFDIE